MKYCVMVVEDEKIEREATILTLEMSCPEIEVVCSAENGVEALRLFPIYKPDIVIMDVDLPGISGLEVVEEMQDISKHTQYIILSAYNIFNYAQKALKMGVHEYLLKPCKTQVLVASLKSAIAAIEDRQTSSPDSGLFHERLDSIRPMLESECIFSIASMRENISVRKMFDFMELKVKSGFVFAIRPENGQKRVITSVKLHMNTMGVVCIGDILNGLCVFIALSEGVFEQKQIEDLMNFISMVLTHNRMECYIGAGQCSKSTEEMHCSYEQALKALAHAGAAGERLVLYTEGLSSLQEKDVFDVRAIVKRISGQMALKDRDGVAREVKECFVQLMMLDDSRERSNLLVYRIYIQIVSALQNDVAEDEFCVFTLEDIQYSSDLCAVCEKMTAQLIALLEKSQESALQQSGAASLAAQAVQYITAHYPEDVNLNHMAEHLNITPFYMSKLFKKHTGKTFTEYLTSYRVEKAKQMIQQKKMSIKEVTYAVGFNSQNYFTKIFKKFTGVTPSEYRGQYTKDSDVRDE